MGGSSQTDKSVPVPEGHYEEESMKQTVVPNRNMILLALAGAWAISTKSDAIAYAAHSGDHAIYPDCRPEFTEAMSDALRLCDWHEVKLMRPFLYPTPMSKADIVKLGTSLGVPFELTWSCYKGGEKHCGKCGTCVERVEAFQLAGVEDPTEYE
jgi:7-cyano-7-deazaguanine synthase